ncbi:MAG TPA: glycosyltransferase family 9 protein, partial [Bacteroidia bacterium]
SILHQFSGLSIVLLGDKNETELGKQINQKGITDLTGKTNLKEAIAIIKNSSALLGTDSGLMHLAAATDIPTFTIWGATNENLYSYKAFNATKHELIHNHISCRPCSAWISANISRFNDPKNCPDHVCIHNITPKMVHHFLHSFLEQHLNNAE